ncbi:succinylglutamate desuccinylase/aspartoacylase family protein [Maritalea mediterranea]|uniref:Succinylglutamate desuccinylase/aspartoacylase family protein n=1 Tax=Maritalea mediterranea TaxID=2909667 RepID=A0ABS9E5D2_9HYPH|nr:succinylglutamate desuccinylase/aspartoacylase family protein [Maritalea mediterranea]MCF4098012.1 succinylglutamate desuccinylase/aspartoacylase family protein [Maritalea mediterranea]
MTRPAFEIGGVRIAPGYRRTVDLPVSVLSDHTPVTMSTHVIHGKRPGPTVFVSAAIHGDEVIGVEIVRRVLQSPKLRGLRGTLICIPIVNAFGFLNHSRYLPDRRDLNRSFPGSETGSLAGRLAHLFITEIVKRSDYGIDLHSAASHRDNYPQVRVTPNRPKLTELANMFGAPILLKSKVREGSLREAASALDCEVLLYEAGGGLRFDEFAVRVGTTGVLRTLQGLGMISGKPIAPSKAKSIFCTNSYWLRSPAGGLLRTFKRSGDTVLEDDILGVVSDPFGEIETPITAQSDGVIIGRSELPIVNEGDATFHVAQPARNRNAETALDQHTADVEGSTLFDEDEII